MKTNDNQDSGVRAQKRAWWRVLTCWLLLLCTAGAQHVSNYPVEKTDTTNHRITAPLTFGTGKTLTFESGSTLSIASGVTFTLPAANGGRVVGEVIDYAGVSVPSLWLACYGQSLTRSSYPELFAALTKSATVTFSNSGGNLKCTWTTHGTGSGTPVSFTATTSTPTGITAGTIYYTLLIDANSFLLQTSPGGSFVSWTNAGTGTQTGTQLPWGAADSTHFNLPDFRGRVAAGLDAMGGTSASRLTTTYSGSGGLTSTGLGGAGGEEAHTLTAGEIPPLGVDVDSVAGDLGGTSGVAGTTAPMGTTTVAGVVNSTGGGNPHNVIQPTLCVQKIIFAAH